MNTNTYQARVAKWAKECFGEEATLEKETRNYRFLEEALELVQSLGLTKAEAIKLVNYVYGRPVGEPRQEIGGVMITLAGLSEANNYSMWWAGEDELNRILQPEIMEIIRNKQKMKPRLGVES